VAMKTVETEDTQKDLAPRRTHDRDDDQKTIDGWTAELVKEFEAAGQPDEENYAGPTRRFATDDGPDGKRRVARAFALVNHNQKDKAGALKVAALWFKNGKPGTDGYVTIKYGVRIVTTAEAATEDAKAENTPEPKTEGDGEKAPFEPTPDQPEQPSGRRGRGFGRA
jgi:hypothetical protein